MDPLTTAALISSAPALIQGVTGALQLGKGKKQQRENERPLYEIPEEVLQSLNSARIGASSLEMAGQSNLEQAQDQILANTTDSITNTASSSPEALAALVKAGANRSDAQNQIGMAAAQDYMRRQQELRGELSRVAGYQDKAWELNELTPYQDKAASASALIGGGMENIFGGLNTIAGVASNSQLIKKYDQDQEKKNAAILAQAGTSNTEPQPFDEGALSQESKGFMKTISTPTLGSTIGLPIPNMNNNYMSGPKLNPYQPQVIPNIPTFDPTSSKQMFYNPF